MKRVYEQVTSNGERTDLGEGSSSKRPRPVIATQDAQSWTIVYSLASGTATVAATLAALQSHLGDRFLHTDWTSILDAVVSDDPNVDTLEIYYEMRSNALGNAQMQLTQPHYHIYNCASAAPVGHLFADGHLSWNSVVPNDLHTPERAAIPPTQDPKAWDSVEELVADTSFVIVLEKLQTYLGDRYNSDDWKSVLDDLLGTDDLRTNPQDVFEAAKGKAMASATIRLNPQSKKRGKEPTRDLHAPERAAIPPTQDPKAWDIVEELVADTSFIIVQEKLQTYLGDRYNSDDWKSVLDDLLGTDDLGTNPQDVFEAAKGKAMASVTIRRKPQTKKGKKPARNPASKFIDNEATIGESDESGEDPDEDSNTNGAELFSERIDRLRRDGQHTKADKWRQTIQSIQQRSQEVSITAAGDGVDFNAGGKDLPSAHLPMPGLYQPKPKTWSGRVPYGSEALIVSAMSKHGLNAYWYPLLRGFVYVEANTTTEIRKFLPPSHRHAVYNFKLLADDALRTDPWSSTLHARTWVRVLRGQFKNALGYVWKLAEDERSAQILLVPRLLRDPTSTKKWGEHPALFDREKISDTYPSFPVTESTIDGHHVLKFRRDYYIHGLLIRDVSHDEIETVSYPHPDDIKLFADSQCDNSLINSSYDAFSKQNWKAGDRVRVTHGELYDAIGHIRTIQADQWAAKISLVFPVSNNADYDMSLEHLRRQYWQGDIVKVLWGQHIGKRGIVSGVSFDDTITFVDDTTNESTCVPSRSLVSEGHNEMLDPTLSSIMPSHPIEEKVVLRGDIVTVLYGEHQNTLGIVLEIAKVDDGIIVSFQVLRSYGDAVGPPSREQLTSTVLSLPRRDLDIHAPIGLLAFSNEKGYDVRPGDEVEIARGEHLYEHGTVQGVDLSSATLTILRTRDDPGHNTDAPDHINIPIVYVVMRRKFVPELLSQRAIGREVFIVAGVHKGFRGNVRGLSVDSCTVGWGALGSVQVIPRCDLVDMSCGMRMNGQVLSMSEYTQCKQAYDRSFVHAHPREACRQRTPPPEVGANVHSGSVWQPDEEDNNATNDALMADKSVPYHWLLDDAVTRGVGNKHICVKFDGGFANGSMVGRVGRTNLPFHKEKTEKAILVAVTYTPKSGTTQRSGLAAVTHLSPAIPSGVGKECVVLKGKHIGEVCVITRYKKKPKKVELRGLEGEFDFADVCLVASPQAP
ncbi:hypothetical protein BJ138DRAFT_1105033 [Hygrophoropsis aurantiaca]|uniref:Uncharacterized protein n=1 Tax=Hygrophoropsis aurantiaca TaxID=72124 RepID=A0ACB7ZZT6_9AGAM|nr:hypothetical protein BJ138DRAFT_1105033 [Hygrophoropsis aurantiaca]